MYDAVTATNVPKDAKIVAGYINGKYQSYPDLVREFPDAIHVSIAVSADADAQVLDCENFDASPEQCPAWAERQRARGQIPTVYMNASTWPAVRSAFVAQKVSEPNYWVANYDGIAEVPAGAIAKQYQGGMTAPYDISAVVDFWPGVDKEPEEFLAMLDDSQQNEIWDAAHQLLFGLVPATSQGNSPFSERGEIMERLRRIDANLQTLVNNKGAN